MPLITADELRNISESGRMECFKIIQSFLERQSEGINTRLKKQAELGFTQDKIRVIEPKEFSSIPMSIIKAAICDYFKDFKNVKVDFSTNFSTSEYLTAFYEITVSW